MDRDWNSIMFDDIGVKIQKIAKVIAWFNIVVSIIGGIVMFFCAFIDIEYLWYLIFLAPVAVVVGCIMAWLSVITLYGFGKLIEDVEAIRNKKPPVIKIEAEQTKQSVPKTNQNVAKNEKNTSPKAPEISPNNTSDSVKKESKQKEVSQNMLPCPQCGEDLAFMGWDDNDLTETQICPMCGKEILFKQ